MQLNDTFRHDNNTFDEMQDSLFLEIVFSQFGFHTGSWVQMSTKNMKGKSGAAVLIQNNWRD